MTSTIDKILDRYSALKAERTIYESEWQELAEVFQPGTQSFTSESKPWVEINRSIDGNGKYLVQKLTAHLFGQLTNPSTKWFEFKVSDLNTSLSKQATIELEGVNKKVLEIFNNINGNFSTECQSFYSSLVVYGCGILFVDNKLGKDIYFKNIPLSQVYIGEDHKGNVDTIFRCFKYTAKQLLQAFGEKKVSPKVLTAYLNTPEQTFEVIHCVYPNLKAKTKNERFDSFYIDVENKQILENKRLKHFPFKVSRWEKHTGEKYGHGQGKLALSTIRALTQIRQEMQKAMEFANSPIVMTSDDGVLLPDSWSPGQVIQGALSSLDGVRRIETWSPSGNPQAGIQQYMQELDLLNKLFFVEDITMPVDKTRRTATEASLISQDKIRFLAPFVSRIQTDFLAPIVELIFELLKDNGIFKDISEELGNQELEVDFLSPLARLLKLEDSRASQQFLQMSLPLIQFKPELTNMINFEEIIADAQKGSGAPAKILKSPEEYAESLQAQQQAQQQQMQMQNALAASEITKNISNSEI